MLVMIIKNSGYCILMIHPRTHKHTPNSVNYIQRRESVKSFPAETIVGLNMASE